MQRQYAYKNPVVEVSYKVSEFKAGFGRVNTTPMMGVEIDGYFEDRFAEGVLDELEANAVAFSCGGQPQVFVCIDLCAVLPDLADSMRKLVAKELKLDVRSIHISATHSHTSPAALETTEDPLIAQYTAFLKRRVVDVAAAAIEDLKPSALGWGVGVAPGITFKRRFRMKDGSTRTNPGVNNPDIEAPIGDVDERVGVLRIDQENGKHIVVVNYANHADTISGCKVSADWPGYARRMVEKALDNTRCVYFNGAEGDVNHVNVWPGRNRIPGYDYANVRHMGSVVAGAVMQVYHKMTYINVDDICCADTVVHVPSNRGDPKDLPEARRIRNLFIEGRKDEIPYTGMMLITKVKEAARMIQLENGPDYFDLPMSAIRLGNVALVTLPGEAFTDIGVALKEAEGWDTVLVLGETDGCAGYFPVTQAYIEGGYEAQGSRYKQGVSELLINAGLELLKETKQVGKEVHARKNHLNRPDVN